ncbi:hypothetical protein [Modicisalibacter zincidurans]|uniref:SDR family NAD(P)-dependent oxidoreductase n=1 Tax=Modicisalibacter zincidurans TaxID=1178777 RepID=A0ABP9RE85_9GAMM
MQRYSPAERLPRPGEQDLADRDIANAVMYAISQPQHIDVNEILVRPTPPRDEI